jgi:hypothetical protein
MRRPTLQLTPWIKGTSSESRRRNLRRDRHVTRPLLEQCEARISLVTVAIFNLANGNSTTIAVPTLSQATSHRLPHLHQPVPSPVFTFTATDSASGTFSYG